VENLLHVFIITPGVRKTNRKNDPVKRLTKPENNVCLNTVNTLSEKEEYGYALH
jgi:hypothetical protein